jgi:membrane-associated phospholipid phosphatase
MAEFKEQECGLNFSCRVKTWKNEILNHKWLILVAILLFIAANILNLMASSYVDKAPGGAAVSDIILNNIPAINLNFLFIYGMSIIIAIFFLYPLLYRVRDLHIAICQFSLLIAIRSIFITLTHLKIPADAILSNLPRIYDFFIARNDLFFSGHVAMSFLGYLLFRKQRIGLFFLIATIIMAATVLLMHVHYSIDVFAAFFITYGTYKLGEWIFPKIKS